MWLIRECIITLSYQIKGVADTRIYFYIKLPGYGRIRTGIELATVCTHEDFIVLPLCERGGGEGRVIPARSFMTGAGPFFFTFSPVDVNPTHIKETTQQLLIILNRLLLHKHHGMDEYVGCPLAVCIITLSYQIKGVDDTRMYYYTKLPD